MAEISNQPANKVVPMNSDKSSNSALQEEQKPLSENSKDNDINKKNLSQEQEDQTKKTPVLLSQNTQEIDFSQIVKIDRVMRSKGIKIIYPFLIIPSKSIFKLIWDSIVLVMIVWLALFLPWQIAYPDDQIEILDIIILVSQFYSYLLKVFFIFDIIINLRTTYFNEDNEEIIDAKMIAKNYVYSINFIIDVASAFPISEIYQGENINVIRILNMIKITRLLRLGRIFRLLQNESLKLLSHIINYLFGFLLLFHWITCIWLVIIFFETDKSNIQINNSWVPSNLRFIYEQASESETLQMVEDFYLNEDVHPSYAQYIFSYYSMLMVILGADIQPISVGQSFYLVFVGILGSVALAILFGKMSHILQQSNQKQAQYQKIEDEITALMRRKNIPQELQAKAFEYFEYCWRKHLLFDRSHKDFSEFSKSLQQQCLDHQFSELIYKVPIFCKIDVTQQESQEVMKRLKTMVFMPGEYVSEYGEVAQEMFFIIEGVIEKVADHLDESQTVQLKKGDFHGWEAMLGTVKNTENILSVGFSTIESLQKQDFVNLIQLYPEFSKHVYESLKHHTLSGIDRLSNLLIGIDIFENFDFDQMNKLLNEYMEIRFIENGQVILIPEEPINAFYIVISGSVDICTAPHNEYINIIIGYANRNILEEHFTDFDELILNEMNTETQQYENLNAFLNIRGLVGKLEIFGYLNFEETSSLISKCYFIASSVTQVGIFTNKSMQLMQEADPQLYEILKIQIRTLEQYYSKVEIMNDEICDLITKFVRVENKNIQKDKIQDRINRLTQDLNGCVTYLKQIANKK